MRLFIRYNSQGIITSAMKVNVMAEGLEHPYGQLGEDERVMEVEPTPELEALDCHEIDNRYVVDIQNKRLQQKG